MLGLKSRIVLLLTLIASFQLSYAESGSLIVYNNVESLEVNIKTQLLCEKYFRVIVPSSSRWEGDLKKENPVKFGFPASASWSYCSLADKQFTDDYNAYNSFDRHYKPLLPHNLVTIELVDLANKRNKLSFSMPVERTGSSPVSKEVDFLGTRYRVSIEHHGEYSGKTVGHYDDFAYFGPELAKSSTIIVVDKP